MCGVCVCMYVSVFYVWCVYVFCGVCLYVSVFYGCACVCM